ncbi:MAG: hypothetical protein QXQ94_06165 [Candidatus Bathyarchaeia archaeon]
MPLEIYLLSYPDSVQEKRRQLGVDVREKRIRDLISCINIISHRKFYEHEGLPNAIPLYSQDKGDTVNFDVVDKIQILGDPVDWIEKISASFKELGIITKTKSYISPQQNINLTEEVRKLRSSIGEGERQEVEDICFGTKIRVQDGVWSQFWDALEYFIDVSQKYDLFLYIPTLAAALAKE